MVDFANQGVIILTKMLLITFLFISFNLFSQNKNEETRALLEILSRNQINLLCNGEIDIYLDLYSKSYTDLGGGSNGDGTIDFKSWREKLYNFVLSDEFEALDGKSVKDLLDVRNQKILDYSEIIADRGFINRFSFILREGDYMVSFPPKEGSILSDGWYAIFRFDDGSWKIIAGD